MPITDRTDLYSEFIGGVYTNVVVITCGDSKVYLNDCGAQFIFGGHTYIPCGFTLNEPDKSNMEEGTGSFTIAGVPSDYIELVQEASPTTTITFDVGLVKVISSNGSISVEGDGYLIDPTAYDVNGIAINSASASLTLNLRTGGALGFFASVKQFNNVDFPGLVG